MSHLMKRRGTPCEQRDGHRGRCRRKGYRWSRLTYDRAYSQSVPGILSQVRSNAKRRGNR
jgi:hypothetical protein